MKKGQLMEEVREYRVQIKGDTLGALAVAVDEMRSKEVPPISQFSIVAPPFGQWQKSIVARYQPEPCYVRDCTHPAVREDRDAFLCSVHTADDLPEEDEDGTGADEGSGIEGVLDELVSDGLVERNEE